MPPSRARVVVRAVRAAHARSRAPQRVLVTGGASGIGRGIVDAFVRRGDRVAYVDVRARLALGFGDGAADDAAATAPPGATFVACDVADAAQVPRAVGEAPRRSAGSACS